MVYYNDNELVIRNMEEADARVFTDEEIAQGWHTDISKYLARLQDQSAGKCVSLTAVYQGQLAGYVSVYITGLSGAFSGKGLPEIVDFGVLEKYQRKGIGSKLMDVAEEIAGQYADTVWLGVGLHSGYGSAQRMYAKRGYIPDGTGVWYRDKPCAQYETEIANDDDLVLFLSKKLEWKAKTKRTNRDLEEAMLDRTIPFCNTIMKCSDYEYRNVELPDGFSIISYQSGHEKEWAKLEYAIGDFDSVTEAESYFVKTYLQIPELLPNILFALNKDSDVVGSCIAWQDLRGINSVSSLHWLVVDDLHQKKGLGRALCTAVMNIYVKHKGLPVYIHTQPWSWKAILLYLSLGFRLQKTDTFSHYENEYDKAMAELKKIVSNEQYELLLQLSED